MTECERVEHRIVNGRRLTVAMHEAAGSGVVVFCHGFRGERTGPNRTFVRAARTLATAGIASLRFDQYGSGDSEGDFVDSSFADWVWTIHALVDAERARGRRVALFGQSMGASAALVAAADVPDLVAVIGWVPDASVEEFAPSATGVIEEAGQLVSNTYWQEAHDADIASRFAEVEAPCYLVFGTADAYVSAQNRDALARRAKPADRVEVFEGYPHSAWNAAAADTIIERSVAFLRDQFRSVLSTSVSLPEGAKVDSMASQTSTIRVTRATRDLLADQARERGVSLAALLSEIADERRREAIWRSEREASRVDSQSPVAQSDIRDWESTLEDGLG